MSVTPLNIPELNLLLALRTFHSAVTTVELGEAFGMDKIQPPVRKRLVDLGFITAWKEGRSYRYLLIAAGARRAQELLREPRPKNPTPRTARILWDICNDISSFMERNKIELADVYAPADAPADRPEDTEARIRVAYTALASGVADWVPLRKLRSALGDLDREVVDKALSAMLTGQAALLIPEENQKTLTPADRDAAIYFGGQARHLIAIERP